MGLSRPCNIRVDISCSYELGGGQISSLWTFRIRIRGGGSQSKEKSPRKENKREGEENI